MVSNPITQGEALVETPAGEADIVSPSTAALILETLQRQSDGTYALGASAVTGTEGPLAVAA